MAAEGKPTGITRRDFDNAGRAGIEFEGRRAYVYDQRRHSRVGMREDVYLVLGFTRDRELALYGYYDYSKGGEFMELDRERLD